MAAAPPSHTRPVLCLGSRVTSLATARRDAEKAQRQGYRSQVLLEDKPANCCNIYHPSETLLCLLKKKVLRRGQARGRIAAAPRGAGRPLQQLWCHTDGPQLAADRPIRRAKARAGSRKVAKSSTVCPRGRIARLQTSSALQGPRDEALMLAPPSRQPDGGARIMRSGPQKQDPRRLWPSTTCLPPAPDGVCAGLFLRGAVSARRACRAASALRGRGRALPQGQAPRSTE